MASVQRVLQANKLEKVPIHTHAEFQMELYSIQFTIELE